MISRSSIKTILITLLLLLMVFGLTLYVGIRNEKSSQWIVERILNIATAESNLSGFTGTLARGINIESLSLMLKDKTKLDLKEVHSQWDIQALRRLFLINNLSVESIELTPSESAPESNSDSSTDTQFEFDLPIDLKIKDLSISEICLKQQQQCNVITDLSSQFSFIDQIFTLDTLGLKFNQLELGARGFLETRLPNNLDVSLTLNGLIEEISSSLDIKGDLSDFTLTANADASITDQPELTATANASGSKTSLVIDQLSLQTDAGSVDIQGDLNWESSPVINLMLKGREIYPGWWNSAIEGKLSIDSNLQLQNSNHQILATVDGKLQDQLVSAKISSTGNLSQSTLADSYLSVGPNTLDFDGELDWQEQFTTDLTLRGQALDLSNLSAKISSALNLDASITTRGTSYTGDVDLDGELNTKPVNTRLVINGDQENMSLKDLTFTSGTSTITANGVLAFANNPQGEFTFNSSQFDPAIFAPAVTGTIDAQGSITLDGDQTKSSITAEGVLHEQPFSLNWLANTKAQLLEIERAIVRSAEGQLEITGSANLDPRQAQLAINGTDFNPQSFFPELPGKLAINGNIEMNGDVFSGEVNLEGSLRNIPVSAQIDANGFDDTLNINAIDIKSGSNSIVVSGALNDNEINNLAWNINAPNLAQVLPQFKGAVEGQGNLSGSLQSLNGAGELSAVDVQIGDISIAKLDFKLQPTEVNNHGIELKGSELGYQQYKVAELEANMIGNLENSSLQLLLTSSAADTLGMNVDVIKNSDSYNITIAETTLTSKSWTTLTQTKVANAVIGAEQVSLEPLCLLGSDELMCVDYASSANTLASTITLQAVPVSRLQSWYKDAAEFSELLNGEIKLQKQASIWTNVSDISLSNGSSLNTQLEHNQQTGALAGEVNANLNDIAILALFSDQILNAKGAANVELSLNGSIKQPVINGDAKLIGAGVTLPSAGITLTDINLQGDANGSRAALISGTASSGGEAINLQGSITYKPLDAWNVELHLSGQNVLVSDLPEYKVIASPDLKLELSAKATTLTGKVRIPEAQITLSALPEKAISVSEDTVILNGDAIDITTENQSLLSVALDVELGDDVRLAGKGLDVRLDGALKIEQQPKKVSNAYGTIELSEGKYNAYGQDLTLKNGRLQFNGPINDPGISLRAERQIKNQIVGLEVGGSVESLSTNIYSDPTIAESNAISYLVTGRALGARGGADNTAIVNAITNLGIKRSSGIINDIRTNTGLSTLQLDGGEDVTDTAILIGKYLTPQLYIEYIKRLFADDDSLLIRYEFNDNLQLEAEAGSQQGIDLIYQIER